MSDLSEAWIRYMKAAERYELEKEKAQHHYFLRSEEEALDKAENHYIDLLTMKIEERWNQRELKNTIAKERERE